MILIDCSIFEGLFENTELMRAFPLPMPAKVFAKKLCVHKKIIIVKLL